MYITLTTKGKTLKHLTPIDKEYLDRDVQVIVIFENSTSTRQNTTIWEHGVEKAYEKFLGEHEKGETYTLDKAKELLYV